jgi:hypothetical protein
MVNGLVEHVTVEHRLKPCAGTVSIVSIHKWHFVDAKPRCMSYRSGSGSGFDDLLDAVVER